MRCEARTLDDIRALGGNDAADERRFATAARVSDINLALYRAFAQPAIQAMMSAPIAEWVRRLHPLRLQYELFSDANPLMKPVKEMAERVRQERSPAGADNPFMAAQEAVSKQIVASLDAWRDMTEAVSERMFLTIYGLPTLQAAVGIDPTDTRPTRKAAKSPLHRELIESRIAELRSRIPVGGLRECMMRAILYVGMARGSVDERGAAAIRRLRATIRAEGPRLTLAEFKALMREQFFMLLLDEEATLGAIPDLLPADAQLRRKAFAALGEILSARGEMVGEVRERFERIAKLFGVEAKLPAPAASDKKVAKAS